MKSDDSAVPAARSAYRTTPVVSPTRTVRATSLSAIKAVASAAVALKIFVPPIPSLFAESSPAGPWPAMPTTTSKAPGAFTGSRESVAVARTGLPAAKVSCWFCPSSSVNGADAPSSGSSIVAAISVGTSPERPLAVGSRDSIRMPKPGVPPCGDTFVSTTSSTPPVPRGTAR